MCESFSFEKVSKAMVLQPSLMRSPEESIERGEKEGTDTLGLQCGVEEGRPRQTEKG